MISLNFEREWALSESESLRNEVQLLKSELEWMVNCANEGIVEIQTLK